MHVSVCVCVCVVGRRVRGQSLERAPEWIPACFAGPSAPLGVRGPDLLQHLLMFLGKNSEGIFDGLYDGIFDNDEAEGDD